MSRKRGYGLLSTLMQLALQDSQAKNNASAARNQSILNTQLNFLKDIGRAAVENGYKLSDQDKSSFDKFGLPFDAVNDVGSQAFQKVGVGPEVDRFSKAGLDAPEGIMDALTYGGLNRAKGNDGDDYAKAILSMISQKQLADPGNIKNLGANPDVDSDVIGSMFGNGQGFLDELIQGASDYDRREHNQAQGLANQKYNQALGLADREYGNKSRLQHQGFMDKLAVMKATKDPRADTSGVADSILNAGATAYKNAMDVWKTESKNAAGTINKETPSKPDTTEAENAAMKKEYDVMKSLYGSNPNVDWAKIDKIMEMRGIADTGQSRVATSEKIDEMLARANDKARRNGEKPYTREQLVKKLKEAGWIIESSSEER